MNGNLLRVFFVVILISHAHLTATPEEIHAARVTIRNTIAQLQSGKLNAAQNKQLYDNALSKVTILRSNQVPAKKIKTELDEAYAMAIQNQPRLKERLTATKETVPQTMQAEIKYSKPDQTPKARPVITRGIVPPTINVEPKRLPNQPTRYTTTIPQTDRSSTPPAQSGSLLEQIQRGTSLRPAQERQLAPIDERNFDQQKRLEEQFKRATEQRKHLLTPEQSQENNEEWE